MPKHIRDEEELPSTKKFCITPLHYHINDAEKLKALQEVAGFHYVDTYVNEAGEPVVSSEEFKNLCLGETKLARKSEIVDLNVYVTDVFKLKKFNGKGLFAGKDFKLTSKNQYLGIYTGHIAEDLPDNSQSYIWATNDDGASKILDKSLIDAEKFGDELRFVNHAQNAVNVVAERRKIIINGNEWGIILYRLVSDIKAGQQFIISYGDRYSHFCERIFLNPADNEASPKATYSASASKYQSHVLENKNVTSLATNSNTSYIPKFFTQKFDSDSKLKSYLEKNNIDIDMPLLTYTENEGFLDIPDEQGLITALMYRCTLPLNKENLAAIEHYLAAGAFVEHQHSTTGHTALFYAVTNTTSNESLRTSLVKTLIEHNAKINTEDASGLTPIHHAICSNSLGAFKDILPIIKNDLADLVKRKSKKNYNSLLGFAVKQKNPQAFEMLLELYEECENNSFFNFEKPVKIFAEILAELKTVDNPEAYIEIMLRNGLKNNPDLFSTLLQFAQDNLAVQITLSKNSRRPKIDIQFRSGYSICFDVGASLAKVLQLSHLSTSPDINMGAVDSIIPLDAKMHQIAYADVELISDKNEIIDAEKNPVAGPITDTSLSIKNDLTATTSSAFNQEAMHITEGVNYVAGELNQSTQLHLALAKNDLAKAAWLINQNCNLELTDLTGLTAIESLYRRSYLSEFIDNIKILIESCKDRAYEIAYTGYQTCYNHSFTNNGHDSFNQFIEVKKFISETDFANLIPQYHLMFFSLQASSANLDDFVVQLNERHERETQRMQFSETSITPATKLNKPVSRVAAFTIDSLEAPIELEIEDANNIPEYSIEIFMLKFGVNIIEYCDRSSYLEEAMSTFPEKIKANSFREQELFRMIVLLQLLPGTSMDRRFSKICHYAIATNNKSRLDNLICNLKNSKYFSIDGKNKDGFHSTGRYSINQLSDFNKIDLLASILKVKADCSKYDYFSILFQKFQPLLDRIVDYCINNSSDALKHLPTVFANDLEFKEFQIQSLTFLNILISHPLYSDFDLNESDPKLLNRIIPENEIPKILNAPITRSEERCDNNYYRMTFLMNLFPDTIITSEFRKLCMFTNKTAEKVHSPNLKAMAKNGLITINEKINVCRGDKSSERYVLTNHQNGLLLKVDSPCLHKDLLSIIFYGFERDLEKIIYYINNMPQGDWLEKIKNTPNEIRFNEISSRAHDLSEELTYGFYKKYDIFAVKFGKAYYSKKVEQPSQNILTIENNETANSLSIPPASNLSGTAHSGLTAEDLSVTRTLVHFGTFRQHPETDAPPLLRRAGFKVNPTNR